MFLYHLNNLWIVFVRTISGSSRNFDELSWVGEFLGIFSLWILMLCKNLALWKKFLEKHDGGAQMVLIEGAKCLSAFSSQSQTQTRIFFVGIFFSVSWRNVQEVEWWKLLWQNHFWDVRTIQQQAFYLSELFHAKNCLL